MNFAILKPKFDETRSEIWLEFRQFFLKFKSQNLSRIWYNSRKMHYFVRKFAANFGKIVKLFNFQHFLIEFCHFGTKFWRFFVGISPKSLENCIFLELYQILDKFWDFLKNLAKFRQNSIKIWLQNGKIQSKNAENWIIHYSISKKVSRFLTEILNVERCEGVIIL